VPVLGAHRATERLHLAALAVRVLRLPGDMRLPPMTCGDTRATARVNITMTCRSAVIMRCASRRWGCGAEFTATITGESRKVCHGA
jgi:hypothetical protein